jgi:predicted membrane protein
MDERANPLNGRLILGVCLMVLGALWTVDNLDLMDADPILRWWAVVPVVIGLMKLTGVGMEKQPAFGLFLTIVGGLFILGEMDVVNVNLGIVWPLMFIFIGARIMMRAVRGQEGGESSSDASDFVRSFAVMGGITRRNESQAFRGGELTAVMGGVQLDLDDAKPADGRAVIDVFAVWGGIEIRVPEDWRVEVEATPLMGGVESNSRLAPGVEPVGTLVVRGFVMMGGVEVKNTPLSDQKGGVVVRTGWKGDRAARREARGEKGVISVPQEPERQNPPAPKEPQ